MQLEVGAILEGKVTGITNFGAFVELGEGKTGMVHISEVAPTYVSDIREHLQENQMVKVKVLSVSDDGKVSLSIKKATPPPPRREPAARYQSPGRPDNNDSAAGVKSTGDQSFENLMNKFKQSSTDKFSDLKRKGTESPRPRRR